MEMKYEIKQKIFSFGDKFIIRDEIESPRYAVRGQIFSFGKKLSIEDLDGNELVYIEQKLFKFLPEYNIYIKGEQVATVKKEFTFFAPRFNIESNMGNYDMQGEIFSHEFEILKGYDVVASVSKQWFSFSDTYGVDISENENQAFMLALVIVIDQVLYDNKK
jgi:uncharacterized protein YxjI